MRDTSVLRSKAETLRALHRPGQPLVLVNAWDCATARIFEKAGSAAIATTSAGIAFSYGYPDGQKIPPDRMLEAVARICEAVSVPVTADMEAGYGTSSEELQRTLTGMLEAGAVELAGDAAELGALGDPPGDLGIRYPEPQIAGPLVERRIGDQLIEQLLVEPERPRLLRADRTVQLAPDELEPLVVELAEPVHRDLGPPDRGHRIAAETAEYVADAPDREADDEKADDGRHDRLAEPTGGGGA